MKNAIVSLKARGDLPLKTILLLCLLCSLLASGCGSSSPTPIPVLVSIPIPTIVPGRSCVLTPGETLPLAVTGVPGSGITYRWSASAGMVIPPDSPTVSYTAPETPGDVIIKVVAQQNGRTNEGMIFCKVVTPVVTPAPSSTSTPSPTSTPVPPPIECNHPSVTKNVFPQLEAVEGQFPFYGLLNDENFLCQGVYDIFRTGPLAVRIEYKNIDRNYGFWGIGTPNGYDVTGFSKICFWVYAQNMNQSFRLKLRDKLGREKGVLINVDQAGQWTQSCTLLSKFSEQEVRLDILENVNLGFEQASGSAIVWVDDFEFGK